MHPAIHVAIPSNYVYKPSLGSLHDYCTKAPDSWDFPWKPRSPSGGTLPGLGGNIHVDVRGPCAKHDLCYAAKDHNKANCDTNLLYNLYYECAFATYAHQEREGDCDDNARLYYWAVVKFGHP